MPNIITVKIDVTKIDKSRLFPGKNGAKYIDLVCIPLRSEGRYGDTHLVKQSATKEERQNKVELPIIGNATERGSREGVQSDAPADHAPERHAPPARRLPPKPSAVRNEDEDVPF